MQELADDNAEKARQKHAAARKEVEEDEECEYEWEPNMAMEAETAIIDLLDEAGCEATEEHAMIQ
eukprot:9777632-Prorocentrum_lima.AAC.1